MYVLPIALEYLLEVELWYFSLRAPGRDLVCYCLAMSGDMKILFRLHVVQPCRPSADPVPPSPNKRSAQRRGDRRVASRPFVDQESESLFFDGAETCSWYTQCTARRIECVQ